MDETKGQANPQVSQPASQPDWQVANHWKPVTDLYQQQATEAPAETILEMPKPPVAEVKKPSKPLSNVPKSIYIFAGIYFLQGLVFFSLAAFIIVIYNSDFSKWIVAQSPAVVPFPLAYKPPREFAALVAEALIVMGVFCVIVSIMWIVRFWWIRWVTMCYAGGTVARAAIYYLAGVASGAGGGYTSVPGMATGMGTGFTPDQRFILTLGCAINLLIFCYLAFYPGVKLAFEKHY